jgi:hypothetical protein
MLPNMCRKLQIGHTNINTIMLELYEYLSQYIRAAISWSNFYLSILV